MFKFGKFGIDHQIKNSPIELNACAPMAVYVHVFRSPNLNFANGEPFAKFNARQNFQAIRYLILSIYYIKGFDAIFIVLPA
jgi:hypothetical protein